MYSVYTLPNVRGGTWGAYVLTPTLPGLAAHWTPMSGSDPGYASGVHL